MTKQPADIGELAARLKEIYEDLSGETSPIPQPQAKRLRKAITEACDKIRRAVEDLDPIKQPDSVFDPSNPNVTGRVIAITMIAQERRQLAEIERAYGSGVYALYYNGDFLPYGGISGCEHPIYVGKADPSSPGSNTAAEQGEKLYTRLNEHRKSIAKAKTTLRVEDFEYRSLVVKSGWQNSAENYLIHLFKPLWNLQTDICYGIGKHGDDPETRANLRSPWDTLHPGRDWAHRDPAMKDARPRDRIVSEIEGHLLKYPPVRTIDAILRVFLEEMRTAS